MKLNKISIASLLTLVMATGCVKDNEFEVNPPSVEDGKIYVSAQSKLSKGFLSEDGTKLAYNWENVTAETEGKMHLAMGIFTEDGAVALSSGDYYSYVEQTTTPTANQAYLSSSDAIAEDITKSVDVHFFGSLNYDNGFADISAEEFSLALNYPSEFNNDNALLGKDFKENLLICGSTTIAEGLSASSPNSLGTVKFSIIPAVVELELSNTSDNDLTIASVDFNSTEASLCSTASYGKDGYLSSGELSTVKASTTEASVLTSGSKQSFYVYLLPNQAGGLSDITVNFSEGDPIILTGGTPQAGKFEKGGYYTFERTIGNPEPVIPGLSFNDFNTTYASALPEDNTWVITDTKFGTDEITIIQALLIRAVSQSKAITLDFSYSSFDNIPANAFFNADSSLTSLVKVVLPDDVKTINAAAFKNCSALGEINLDGITSFVGYQTFVATGLTNVTASGVTGAIAITNMFNNSTSLESVSFPNATAVTGVAMFNGCSKLNSITLGTQATSIELGDIFGTLPTNTIDLQINTTLTGASITNTNLTITDGNTYAFNSINGVMSSSWALSKFSATNYPEGTNWQINNTSATLAEFATLIEALNAEENKEKQITVTFTELLSVPASTAENGIFKDVTNIDKLILSNATSIGNYALESSSFTAIEAPELLTIGNYSLSNCAALSSVSMDKLQTIASQSFSKTAITSFESTSVTSVGGNAFYSCSKLTNVSLPNITTLANNIFNACSALKTITLATESTIESFNTAIFSGLTVANVDLTINPVGGDFYSIASNVLSITNGASLSFASINYEETGSVPAQGWEYALLSNYSKNIYPETNTWYITDATITVDTDYSGLIAALNATDLTEVTLVFSEAENFPAITSGSSAPFFNKVTNANIQISMELEKATYVGTSYFYNFTKLVAVELPLAETISGQSFRGTSIQEFSAPNATQIFTSVFYACASLTKASFPKATIIGANAFNGCSSLKTLEIATDEAVELTTVDAAAFTNAPISEVALSIYTYNSENITITDNTLSASNVDNQFSSITVAKKEDQGSQEDQSSTTATFATLSDINTTKDIWIITDLGVPTKENINALRDKLVEVTDTSREITVKLTGITSFPANSNISFLRGNDNSHVITVPFALELPAITSTVFGNGAFNADALVSIKAENYTAAIPNNLFNGCKNIKTIYLPKVTNFAGTNAVNLCTGATFTIGMEAEITSLASFNATYSAANNLVVNPEFNTSVSFNSITAGGISYTFKSINDRPYQLNEITTSNIPEGTEWYISTSGVTTANRPTFEEMAALTEVLNDSEVATRGRINLIFIDVVVFPAGVSNLGALNGVTTEFKLTVLTTASPFTAYNSFRSCAALKEVYIPNINGGIAPNTFIFCNLEVLSIATAEDSSLTYIGNAGWATLGTTTATTLYVNNLGAGLSVNDKTLSAPTTAGGTDNKDYVFASIIQE